VGNHEHGYLRNRGTFLHVGMNGQLCRAPRPRAHQGTHAVCWGMAGKARGRASIALLGPASQRLTRRRCKRPALRRSDQRNDRDGHNANAGRGVKPGNP
jgi:hypothetical protein